MPSSDRYATLQKIQHPTLVVHGTKDIVVLPVNAFILARASAGLRSSSCIPTQATEPSTNMPNSS